MKEQRSAYDYLSKYRTELMGIAILWVIWFHSVADLEVTGIAAIDGSFRFLKRIGYIGVEIFLLVGGMGIWNSLQKNSIPVFLKNRFKRIAPIWFLDLFSCLFILRLDLSLKEILAFSTFTWMWTDDSALGNWYVYAVMFFYALSPVFYSLMDSAKSKRRACALLILFWLAVSARYMGSYQMRVFARFPIYIIGMYLAADTKDKKLTTRSWLLLAGWFVLGMAWYGFIYLFHYDYFTAFGFWYLPLIIVTPPLAVFFAKGMDLGGKILKPLLALFRVCGKCSLEILLFSAYLFEQARNSPDPFWQTPISSLGVMIASVIVGIVLRSTIVFVSKLIAGRRSEKNAV